jgi:hypothetical protein
MSQSGCGSLELGGSVRPDPILALGCPISRVFCEKWDLTTITTHRGTDFFFE